MRRLVAPALALAATLAMAACAMRQSPEAQKFVVFFTDFSAQLDDAAKQTVARAAHSAGDHPDAGVYVVGYAAADNSPAANRALSVARAHVVADALRDAGVPPGRIRTHGKGPIEYALDPLQARRVVVSIEP